MTDNVYAIILAAGESRRMGTPKQLLEWRNHRLLEHAILNAQAIFGQRIIIVLGANADVIKATIDFNSVTLVLNENWQEGIASSIRAGIQALPKSATSALLLLGDQPLIKTPQLQQLLNYALSEPTKIVASEYNGVIGVPALFPASFFANLLTLSGDKGAKFLLQKFEQNLLKISLPQAEFDIDCADDFERLKKRNS